ncbi:YkvA family protein [Quadrisphaera sp. INWT6]|uniref:YkvA family protein n=1 Tax=Quadrisphaera sp. INWT6 TaxID=2596917 RepID=UPI0019D610B7|nr:YkvA family protein [Quadrisphaera sp. INWT6]
MSAAGRSASGAARSLWWAMRRSRTRGGPKPAELLKALPRMAAATAAGRYTGCSRVKLGLMVAAAGYVVSPVDLLPEGILGPIGLADDAAVLAWLAGALMTEVGDYLEWERLQQRGAGAGPAPGASTGPSSERPAAGPRRRWGSSRPDDGPEVVQGDVIG